MHPRIAPGKGASVLGEVPWPGRVLEIPDPVRYAEVAQADNGLEAQASHLGEDRVAEVPVLGPGTEVHSVVRWAIAQVADA